MNIIFTILLLPRKENTSTFVHFRSNKQSKSGEKEETFDNI